MKYLIRLLLAAAFCGAAIVYALRPVAHTCVDKDTQTLIDLHRDAKLTSI